MQRIIYSGWMGPNAMSEPRSAALLSLVRNAGCPQAHVTTDTLASWTHPAYPLHPLFNLLSAVHKCDYLRCYLLHVFGGGYADVKHTARNWNPFFEQVERSAAFGAGYTEVGAHGVARVGGALELEMQQNYTKVIGLCAMIFRPQTDFTALWYQQLHALIDSRADALLAHPARHPQDRLGAAFTDGSVSEYPFEWTEVGGNIFHPIAYRHSEWILQLDMAPSFENYR
jgi:hypothetical protein